MLYPFESRAPNKLKEEDKALENYFSSKTILIDSSYKSERVDETKM